MKTLALIQGDLAPSAGGYIMYEGAPKIHQDLSLALREDYGGDALHPRWGSTLSLMVGSPLTEPARQRMLAEVTRVVNNYITVQNARLAQDNLNGNPSALTSDDIVVAVSNITVKQVWDSVLLTVTLQTASRQTITVNQVIG